MKLLSICIPTYNRCQYVTKLVRNIISFSEDTLNQIDIVISDNCSNDQTQDFFSELKSKNLPYLRYHRQATNIGATQNLYTLIELAQTQYMWWLGDDDWIEEHNIVLLLDRLKQKEYGIIILNRCVVLNETKQIDSLFSYFMKESKEMTLQSMIGCIGPYTLLGCISSLIFERKRCLNKTLFDFYCDFETSHPHIGFLLETQANQLSYCDFDNRITTYAERQTPDEYEHHRNNKKNLSLVDMLATNFPKMYFSLVKKNSLSQTELRRGKEFLWDQSCTILSSVHADLLLTLTILRGNTTEEINKEAILYLQKIYGDYAILSRVGLMAVKILPKFSLYKENTLKLKENTFSIVKKFIRFCIKGVLVKFFLIYAELIKIYRLGTIK